jgi:hypothetical protein
MLTFSGCLVEQTEGTRPWQEWLAIFKVHCKSLWNFIPRYTSPGSAVRQDTEQHPVNLSTKTTAQSLCLLSLTYTQVHCKISMNSSGFFTRIWNSRHSLKPERPVLVWRKFW